MAKLRAASLTTLGTSGSVPSVFEIVELFCGLLVQKSINNFIRVFKTKYIENPLEPGYVPSRFGFSSQIVQIEKNSMTRITYGAQTIDTAIYESIVRDEFDLQFVRTLFPSDYLERTVVSFSNESSQVLSLLELTHGKATCFGVPTDVIRSSEHTEGQHFSRFIYENMPNVDGFIYSSRFTEEECVALYHNRVISKLSSTTPVQLNKEIVTYAMLSKNVRVE